MKRFLKRLTLFLVVLAILSGIVGGATLYWLVAVNPGPEIKLSYIEGILGRESPVFYRDGKQKIGVLFQKAHRQYLPFRLIPKPFINAIVAAEDDRFFHHFGIDIPGIIRAMIANIKAGRIVQGGSTITQQTAKNLFKRKSRSYRAKLRELLNALRLEHYYSKDKILEFYINQFFVSGNGHGLGVAARYYFDKNVNKLTLLEDAFIAGSVKRPNYYNPFIKKNRAAADLARKRAKERAAYVLGKMRRLKMISEAQYDQAMNSTIVFRRGKMSFALNTVMDMVRDGLSTPEITNALEEHGISNVSTSGIKIITSIDPELQKKTLYDLRRELSRLDVRLRGYDRDQVQREYRSLDYKGDTQLNRGAFMFGHIEAIRNGNGRDPEIRVKFGHNLPDGIIDRQGLERMLTALVRYKEQRWSKAADRDLPLLLSQLRPGDRVCVSIRKIDQQGTPLCDLERFPLLQGAALVMQHGVVRAMVGGMENRYFNRAVDARRLMGSTFKPFLFAAAMQLGWNSTDMLDNRRNIFVFQGKPYFPRPDHHSPYAEVSMSWTGVNSENLAAVWLLCHLTARLTPPRLREVAAHLDLAPRGGGLQPESYEHFKRRIRDHFGIRVNQETLEQAAYDRAVKALEADFLFDDRSYDYGQLRQLPYGLHFDTYTEAVDRDLEDLDLPEQRQKELQLRRKILARNYLDLQPVMEALDRYRRYLALDSPGGREKNPLAFLDSESGNPLPDGHFRLDPAGRVVFSLQPPGKNWRLLSESALRERLRNMDEKTVRTFWDNVQLDGILSVYAFRHVSAQMARERTELFSHKPYSMAVLASVPDYRLMVGLQYLVHFGRALGVRSELEPVLSFPLGSNVISLMDAVHMYETLVTGKRYGMAGEEKGDETGNDGLAIIERIETVDGEVLYSQKPVSDKVLDPRNAAAVGNILQNIVRYGTGAYAHAHVRLNSTRPEKQQALQRLDLPVPLLGKTGTANRFRNAAFFGYVPRLAHDKTVMRLADGYTIGVYVGFDDNRPMVRGTTHLTGAAGALPAWSAIASAALNLDHPGDRVDVADLGFNGLHLQYPETGEVFVPVDPQNGGAVIGGRGALRSTVTPSLPAVLTYGQVVGGGHFEPARFFQPYWKNHQ
ncbi:penicillin-binding protein 1A [bacterium BMS3Bbin14]|nr:penicillin-binding protein 1A [bacterium BMS3Abin13]GBE51658.1 penicillin-binding protein 1A [bacterium BMS3Bbin14]